MCLSRTFFVIIDVTVKDIDGIVLTCLSEKDGVKTSKYSELCYTKTSPFILGSKISLTF